MWLRVSDDPAEEVQFADGRIFKAGHGNVLFHHETGVIYMAMPLRNAGAGIAYLHGYRLEADPAGSVQANPLDPARHRRGEVAPDPSRFAVQQRDVYIAPARERFLAGGPARSRRARLRGHAGGAPHSRPHYN